MAFKVKCAKGIGFSVTTTGVEKLVSILAAIVASVVIWFLIGFLPYLGWIQGIALVIVRVVVPIMVFLAVIHWLLLRSDKDQGPP